MSGPTEWTDALCREPNIPEPLRLAAAGLGITPADLWHPDRTTMVPIDRAVASYCDVCPVRDACFQYAIDNTIEYGIWGGELFSPRFWRGRRYERVRQPSRTTEDEGSRQGQPAA